MRATVGFNVFARVQHCNHALFFLLSCVHGEHRVVDEVNQIWNDAHWNEKIWNGTKHAKGPKPKHTLRLCS